MDRVIAPSHYIAEEAVINGIAKEKILVIPHFTEKNPTNVYVEPAEKTILFLGRLDPLKGMVELLTALQMLKDQAWQACLIGGDERGERLAEELGLTGRIRFVRKVPYPELDTYYQKASMLVFPSMSPESFGLVGIEAMSFGRPVIAFDSGGPREWLDDQNTGFLIKRGDVAGLASAINKLLQDPERASKMGKAGMALVAARFRRQKHVGDLLGVYEGAMRRGGTS